VPWGQAGRRLRRWGGSFCSFLAVYPFVAAFFLAVYPFVAAFQ
jgi:hypothetical protein